MRPATVSDEQIIEAGKELDRKKVAVNGWSLRNFIGSGKPERLHNVWKNFIGDVINHDEARELTEEHVLPTIIDELLTSFTEGLSKKLREIVVKSDIEAIQIADIKAKLTCSKLEEENKNYKEQLDFATSTLEDVDIKLVKLNTLESQNKVMQDKLTEFEKELVKYITKNEGLESLLAERQALVNEKSEQVLQLKGSSDEQQKFITKLKSILTAKQLVAIETD